MKVLVTGFGQFLENSENPTKSILRLLPNRMDSHEIVTVEAPVIFGECFYPVKEMIDVQQPDVIIMLGLAGGRKAITPERIAINLNDSRFPDNIGNCPTEDIIQEDGDNAYFSTLSLREIEAVWQSKQIPTQISNTAGLYVCNNLFYQVMHYIQKNQLPTKAGFIHVPFMDEQEKPEGAFSLPLQTLLEAIIDAIKVSTK